MINMAKRKIIKIDEDKCDGCGLCIPNCPEGALQVIDGKARLISDLFCDGLGACIGHCPKGAIKIEEREAEKYDEKKVMENIVKQGKGTIKAHLMHLKEHGETKYLDEALSVLKDKMIKIPELEEKKMEGHGCPGARMMDLSKKKTSKANSGEKIESELTQWPIQLSLVPVHAPFLENCHLLVAADCVAFATAEFHHKLLAGKKLMIGCPKFDDVSNYKEKLTELFKNTKIKSVTVAVMEVPCCQGLSYVVEEAIKDSGKKIPLIKETITIGGEIL